MLMVAATVCMEASPSAVIPQFPKSKLTTSSKCRSGFQTLGSGLDRLGASFGFGRGVHVGTWRGGEVWDVFPMGGSFTDLSSASSGDAGLGKGDGGFAGSGGWSDKASAASCATTDASDAAALATTNRAGGCGTCDSSLASAVLDSALAPLGESCKAPGTTSSDKASTMVVVHHLKRAPAAWLARYTRWKVSGSGGLIFWNDPL
mmetsp:Transcript_24702/g.43180  ORF Transcript_24702/g.43180 Transcript_24702/m.43180 type:complete len:204 (+) Transcript_24702:398-1009(+)